MSVCQWLVGVCLWWACGNDCGSVSVACAKGWMVASSALTPSGRSHIAGYCISVVVGVSVMVAWWQPGPGSSTVPFSVEPSLVGFAAVHAVVEGLSVIDSLTQ